jgi:hypothetical protein
LAVFEDVPVVEELGMFGSFAIVGVPVPVVADPDVQPVRWLDEPSVPPGLVWADPGLPLFAPGAAGPGATAGGAAPAVPGDVAVPVPDDAPADPDVPPEAPPELWANVGDVAKLAAKTVATDKAIRELRVVDVILRGSNHQSCESDRSGRKRVAAPRERGRLLRSTQQRLGEGLRSEFACRLGNSKLGWSFVHVHWCKGRVMSEYAECRTQALQCLVELQREDLPRETRELLEWTARQWLVLAAERAILDGFDGHDARSVSPRPHWLIGDPGHRRMHRQIAQEIERKTFAKSRLSNVAFLPWEATPTNAIIP